MIEVVDDPLGGDLGSKVPGDVGEAGPPRRGGALGNEGSSREVRGVSSRGT